jgi:hypothetical protein
VSKEPKGHPPKAMELPTCHFSSFLISPYSKHQVRSWEWEREGDSSAQKIWRSRSPIPSSSECDIKVPRNPMYLEKLSKGSTSQYIAGSSLRNRIQAAPPHQWAGCAPSGKPIPHSGPRFALLNCSPQHPDWKFCSVTSTQTPIFKRTWGLHRRSLPNAQRR